MSCFTFCLCTKIVNIYFLHFVIFFKIYEHFFVSLFEKYLEDTKMKKKRKANP